jgi:hypothetical protein
MLSFRSIRSGNHLVGESPLDERLRRGDFGNRLQQSSAILFGTSDLKLHEAGESDYQKGAFSGTEVSENPIGERFHTQSSANDLGRFSIDAVSGDSFRDRRGS